MSETLWLLGAPWIAGQTEGADSAAAVVAETAAPTWRVVGLVLAVVVALLTVRRWRSGKRFGVPCGALLTLGLLAWSVPSTAQTWLDGAIGPVWRAVGPVVSHPLTWAVGLGAAALLAMIPRGTRRQFQAGLALGVVSLGFWARVAPGLAAPLDQTVFWALALTTLGGAAMTISVRSPVYSAIWFAQSLLGAAGLFFFQGAQFLGLATVVVYAGAIVVTFLFVIMVAQPEGHATYDRLTWRLWGHGASPITSKHVSVLVGAALVAVLAYAIGAPGIEPARREIAKLLPQARDAQKQRLIADDDLVEVAAEGEGVLVQVRGTVDEQRAEALGAWLAERRGGAVRVERLSSERNVLHSAHMAHLGAELFGRQLLSVELAGTLLLAALVGAVAIAIQGKDIDAVEAPAGE